MAYFELDMTPIALPSGANDREESSSTITDCIHLEMSCRKLTAVGKSNLFLLIAKNQAARRMKKIIWKKPVLRGRQQAVMLGLSSLMVRLFRGGDTPLLTEDL